MNQCINAHLYLKFRLQLSEHNNQYISSGYELPEKYYYNNYY